MSIACVRTGATVYVDPWGGFIHGDAFETMDGTIFLKWNGEVRKDIIPTRIHYVFHTWAAHWCHGQKEQILVVNQERSWKYPYEGNLVVTDKSLPKLKAVLNDLFGDTYKFFVSTSLQLEEFEKDLQDGKKVDLSEFRFFAGI